MWRAVLPSVSVALMSIPLSIRYRITCVWPVWAAACSIVRRFSFRVKLNFSIVAFSSSSFPSLARSCGGVTSPLENTCILSSSKLFFLDRFLLSLGPTLAAVGGASLLMTIDGVLANFFTSFFDVAVIIDLQVVREGWGWVKG